MNHSSTNKTRENIDQSSNNNNQHGGGANKNPIKNDHHDADVDASIIDYGGGTEAGDSCLEHDDTEGRGISRDDNRISHPDQEEMRDDEDGGDDEYSGETVSSFPYPIGDITCWRSVRSVRDFCRTNSAWTRQNKTQIVSGITLALAQVPESVAFSMVVGVNPVLGLQSAWIMGLVTSLTGGRPGMVAGATGAVSVVLTNLVAEFGIGHLFYACMLAGFLQVLFGVLRLGEAIRLIPHPVMVGFCNGLGLVIGFAQINNFRVPTSEDGDYVVESTSDGGSLAGVFRLFGPLDPLMNDRSWAPITMIYWMMFHAVMTIITYALLPRISTTIPASVAAVSISTILEYVLVRPLGFETYTVNDYGPIQQQHALLPIWIKSQSDYDTTLPALDTKLLGDIFLTSFFTAFIGLFESLLTMQIIDELTESQGSANREACGQGLGQICCGIFGGMGGCTTIGQSLMNMHSGGYTRLSSSVAAVVLLFITVIAYPLINLVPLGSLAGVMFLVSFFTIEWDSIWVVIGSLLPQFIRIRFGFHTKVKRSDVIIMVLVVAITLILDLAIAVIVGCLLACLVFAWDAGTRLTVRRLHVSDDNGGESAEYTVRGPLYFGSVKPLMEAFFPLDNDDDDDDEKSLINPKRATIDLRETEIYDWSGIMAVKTLHDRFESNGTSVVFMNLSISSQALMAKSKRLWEDVVILVDDDTDSSSEFQGIGGDETITTTAGCPTSTKNNNNDDTEVGTSGAAMWEEGASVVLADDATAGPPPGTKVAILHTPAATTNATSKKQLDLTSSKPSR